MSDSLQDEIAANLDRARESIEAACTLLDAGYPDFSASRAYYAAFYAASAALLAQGQRFSKHSHVIGAVHQRFIRTGKLDRSHGRDLNWLFEIRALGDYGETRRVSVEEAGKAIDAARQFVNAVEPLCTL